ncbi:MAG: PAS domain S-box protein [Candidatus Hodarchaeota archaeon]
MRKNLTKDHLKTDDIYRLLVERANDGMVIIQDRLIKFINPSLAKMTGYIREELINTPFTDYIHPDCVEELVSRYTQRMKGINVPNIYETKILTNSGNILDVEINATLFTYQDKPADLVIIRDITERKRAENIIRLAKLEEERYHGMLSHFLNNDLQKIVNQLEFLSLSYKSSHIIDEESINKIIDIVHHSSKTIGIVSKIFDVLKTPFYQQEQKSLDLLKIIDFTLYGLQSSISTQSEITIRRETLDYVILADNYLEDIFYHVFLFFLSSNKKNWPIVIEGSHNPSYFCILVRDFCSQPIPKEIILSISEIPTDEMKSQGNYLGISLVSIVLQYYGGFLTIRPFEQKGNEFQLCFPLKLIQS